jgi:type I restriction enzyme S subunit
VAWPLIKIKECCTVVGGATPKRDVPEYWGNDFPWITPKDISNLDQPVLADAPEYISQAGYDSAATYMLPKGAILLTSRAPIGNVAIAGREMCTNQGFKSLVPGKGVDSKYLYYCMKRMAPKLESIGNGATFKEVSKTIVEGFEIPLPPLKEQKRLAAILDKADAFRRKRQQAIQLADEFFRSVFLDMFGDPVNNSMGWKIEKLGDIAKIQIGPFGTQLHKEDYIEGGIPLINPTHIVGNGIRPSMNLTVSNDKYLELPEYHLKVGDIVMGRRGEMGRCAVITEKENGWVCGTGSLYIRPAKTGVFSDYLDRLISGNSIKAWLESESQGATLPNLNKTIVGNIRVPVPSDDALERFSEIAKKIARIRDAITSCSKEPLFHAVSQRAFRGDL